MIDFWIKLSGVHALQTIGTATISKMFSWFCSVLNPEPASDVTWLEEFGHRLNNSYLRFKLQFNKCFNILSGYFSAPTRMPPSAGIVNRYSSEYLGAT